MDSFTTFTEALAMSSILFPILLLQKFILNGKYYD